MQSWQRWSNWSIVIHAAAAAVRPRAARRVPEPDLVVMGAIVPVVRTDPGPVTVERDLVIRRHAIAILLLQQELHLERVLNKDPHHQKSLRQLEHSHRIRHAKTSNTSKVLKTHWN